MCALFGVLDYKGVASHSAIKRIVQCLGICSEARGTDASGIAFNKNKKTVIQKCPKRASKMHWKFPTGTRCIMGHTRMTTQGNEHFNPNNHPFFGKLPNSGGFALAHNGIISNYEHLRICNNISKTCIKTDSYIAVQLLELAGRLNFTTIKNMAEAVQGVFTFTILDNHNMLYIIKGENPICVYHYPEIGLYIYTSTEEIMTHALQIMRLNGMGKRQKILIEDGEILRINQDGNLDRDTFQLPVTAAPNWFNSYKKLYVEPFCGETESQILCETFGLTEEDINTLLDYGLDFEEIEAMLSNGANLHNWPLRAHSRFFQEEF